MGLQIVNYISAWEFDDKEEHIHFYSSTYNNGLEYHKIVYIILQ